LDAFKLARGFVYAGVKRIGLASLALLPRFGGEVPHGDEGRFAVKSQKNFASTSTL
jgi:hypothetical protein